MASEVWVLAEEWKGQISEPSFETLALGREVAGALHAPLAALLLAHDRKELANALGRADRVLYIDHPSLAAPVPQLQARAVAELAQAHKPAIILIPLTNQTWELGTLVAAQLETAYVNGCKDLRAADGRLTATSVLYGGKMEARVDTARAPAILGVLPGVRPADQGRSDRPATVEEITVTLLAISPVRLHRYLEPEAGDVDITKQEALVSVGRGIQTQDNVAIAEELAATLGGAVSGSRPVIDQGWLPLSRQVGKSGAIVKPKLYVAAGISGAPEHVEGMKSSALIIAINTDPQAPIFNVAHYGITGDATELLPAITAAIRARKG